MTEVHSSSSPQMVHTFSPNLTPSSVFSISSMTRLKVDEIEGCNLFCIEGCNTSALITVNDMCARGSPLLYLLYTNLMVMYTDIYTRQVYWRLSYLAASTARIFISNRATTSPRGRKVLDDGFILLYTPNTLKKIEQILNRHCMLWAPTNIMLTTLRCVRWPV